MSHTLHTKHAWNFPLNLVYDHISGLQHHPQVAEITNLKVIPETSLSPMFFDKSCGPWSVTKLIICSFTQTSMPPQTSNHCLNPIPVLHASQLWNPICQSLTNRFLQWSTWSIWSRCFPTIKQFKTSYCPQDQRPDPPAWSSDCLAPLDLSNLTLSLSFLIWC